MKKKIFILSAFVLSLSLSGCIPKKEVIQENFQTQQEFDEYIEESFKESVEDNFVNYHILLVNPEKKNIEKPEVTLGSLLNENKEEIIEEANEELEELYSFNKNELNQEQRNLYHEFESNIKYTLEGAEFLDFYFPFGADGENDALISVFTNFRISNQEDIEDYITLLNDTQRYFNEGIEYTRQQANKGNIQNEIVKDYVIEQCNKFINSQEIQKYFESQLTEMNMDENLKQKYQIQVNDAVENVVKKAYEEVVKLYKELEVSKYQGSLSEIKNGKEYYEWLLKGKTGSERSAEEWAKISEQEIKTLMNQILMLMFTSDIEEEVSKMVPPTEDIQEMVEYLEESIHNEFPEIEKVNYTVSYLDESVANEYIGAYYVTPPIDAPDLNTIKVNPIHEKDMIHLMSTLAHEGFPGHLYETNYRVQNSKYDIYPFIAQLGYQEGWANYVGGDIYRLCNVGNTTAQEYLRLNEYINYLIYGYYDVMVHYYGWKVEEIKESLTDFGFMPDMAEDFFETFITTPATYAPYSFGMYEVLALKEKAQEELKNNFDIKEFHKAFLDVGPLSFEVVEEAIDRYIEENQ